MHCAVRSPEPALAIFVCVAVTLASCVLDEAQVESPIDAPADAADASSSSPARDASVEDAPPAPVDAARPPAPRVACPSTGPCALALRAPADASVKPVAEAFCALLSSGRVACWGTNARGELGREDEDASAGPRPGFVTGLTKAKELDRNCALREGGDVECWGHVIVPGVSVGDAPLPGLTKLPIGPAKKISIAGTIGCALLSNDRVTCWGLDSSSGQLSYAKAAGGDGPVYGPMEVPLPSGPRIVGVVAGESINGIGGATLVLRDDKAALSWGRNRSLGRLSSFVPDPSPGAVDLPDIAFLTAGGGAICAIASGKVFCWGDRVGAPKELEVYDAVHVATAGPRPLGRGCAVTRGGDVHCWGTNDLGEAGDGTTVAAPRPVKVIGLPSAAVSVEVTLSSTCAVLVSGKVFCWGGGALGQLGREVLDGNSTTPIEVVLPEEP